MMACFGVISCHGARDFHLSFRALASEVMAALGLLHPCWAWAGPPFVMATWGGFSQHQAVEPGEAATEGAGG